MKYIATLLLILGFGLSGFGQTIKSLGYNTTNGQVVANTGTNKLNFTNHVAFGVDGIETYQAGFRGYGVSLNLEERVIEDVGLVDPAVIGWSGGNYIDLGLPLFFPNTTNAATTRANLGFSTNLNTLWTATNASNARSAVGLGATWLTNTDVNLFRESLDLGTNNAYFDKIKVFTESRGAISPPLTDNPEYGILYARETGDNIVLNIAPSGASGNYTISFDERLGSWAKTTNSATARTNLGLGGGITATNTFVSYNGTNYTTNTVTISNGIITGWTQ